MLKISKTVPVLKRKGFDFFLEMSATVVTNLIAEDTSYIVFLFRWIYSTKNWNWKKGKRLSELMLTCYPSSCYCFRGNAWCWKFCCLVFCLLSIVTPKSWSCLDVFIFTEKIRLIWKCNFRCFFFFFPCVTSF